MVRTSYAVGVIHFFRITVCLCTNTSELTEAPLSFVVQTWSIPQTTTRCLAGTVPHSIKAKNVYTLNAYVRCLECAI